MLNTKIGVNISILERDHLCKAIHGIIIKMLTLMFDIYFKGRNIPERNFLRVIKSQKLEK